MHIYIYIYIYVASISSIGSASLDSKAGAVELSHSGSTGSAVSSHESSPIAAKKLHEQRLDEPLLIDDYLVGGLEHEFHFSIYSESSSQLTVSHIFQRCRAQPPTSYAFNRLSNLLDYDNRKNHKHKITANSIHNTHGLCA